MSGPPDHVVRGRRGCAGIAGPSLDVPTRGPRWLPTGSAAWRVRCDHGPRGAQVLRAGRASPSRPRAMAPSVGAAAVAGAVVTESLAACIPRDAGAWMGTASPRGASPGQGRGSRAATIPGRDPPTIRLRCPGRHDDRRRRLRGKPNETRGRQRRSRESRLPQWPVCHASGASAGRGHAHVGTDGSLDAGPSHGGHAAKASARAPPPPRDSYGVTRSYGPQVGRNPRDTPTA